MSEGVRSSDDQSVGISSSRSLGVKKKMKMKSDEEDIDERRYYSSSQFRFFIFFTQINLLHLLHLLEELIAFYREIHDDLSVRDLMGNDPA